MKNRTLSALLLLFEMAAMFSGCTQSQQKAGTPAAAPGGTDRTVLPIKAPPRPTFSELDVRNVTKPERFEVKAPEGAPNVIGILIAQAGRFGRLPV
jgi:hypothetical protein